MPGLVVRRIKPKGINQINWIISSITVMIEALRVTHVPRERIGAGPAAGEAVALAESGVVQAGGFVAFGHCEALAHFVGYGIFLR